ncbi:PREDICTED: uncharacterized protein LOC109217935 [Nicotiana attenuata]|uniref:uncharacterized protein LOC109217935 n=1 Tax=Nicotiana attenuata TaxID=49451 RepID=UPI0009058998|nr:PREDICTED: uncharacterized protein LOC109217935 [Nicotiana attenuata]
MGDSSLNTGPCVPEPTSPLFLLPSDVPGVSLVSVPFSGTGFGGWKRNMIVSLSTKNKIGFIDGSCVKSVQYSETAESIWKELNNRYGTVSGTKVFEIKRELSSTYQGSLDVASYFNKLKKLWDELEIMRSSHANACAAKEGLQKEKEEDKVHQFLMGLNEVYVGVRSNILMMHPLPSIDNVYNILLQDEKQRQVLPNPQAYSESASFHANSNKFPPQFSPQQQYPQKLKFDQFNQRVNPDHSTASLFCKYCKKHGHVIEKCYKLHGFPQNFKFTRGKKFGTAATVKGQPPGVSNHTPSNAEDSLIPGLTKEQYTQLMSLLQQSGLNESSSQPIIMGSANFAGSSSSLPVCLNGTSNVRMLTNVAGRIWIVDSGATDHMTSNKNLLFNITPLPIPYLVPFPNGYKVKVTCPFYEEASGACIKQPIPLPVVSDSSVSSFNTIAEVHDFPLNAHIDVLNSLHDPVSLPNCNSNQHINKNDVFWHHRPGHVPFAQMKNIPSISSSLPAKQSFICPICPLARQPRLSFPNNSTHSTALFQLIHVDTWGPYHTQSYSGPRYFLTIVDDYSRETWTHLVHSKSYAFSLIKAFIAMVKTQFQLPTKSLEVIMP